MKAACFLLFFFLFHPEVIVDEQKGTKEKARGEATAMDSSEGRPFSGAWRSSRALHRHKRQRN